jgi:hypothetical protein
LAEAPFLISTLTTPLVAKLFMDLQRSSLFPSLIHLHLECLALATQTWTQRERFASEFIQKIAALALKKSPSFQRLSLRFPFDHSDMHALDCIGGPLPGPLHLSEIQAEPNPHYPFQHIPIRTYTRRAQGAPSHS